MVGATMPDSEIYVWATDGFDRFTTIWQFEDFWTRANTFEACLRFVKAAQAKWPADPEVEAMETFLQQEMIPANQTYFTFYLSQAMWADDYGWCGIASLTLAPGSSRSGRSPSRTTSRRTARRGSPAGCGRATRDWSSERSRASCRSRTP
jgi:hypothetical protein